ncbi:hypothetical protein DW085_15265 [Clostridium sp. AF50-3]|nr:hypothetical protein DW085_15265 [Clostridium sp. AF50-3]
MFNSRKLFPQQLRRHLLKQLRERHRRPRAVFSSGPGERQIEENTIFPDPQIAELIPHDAAGTVGKRESDPLPRHRRSKGGGEVGVEPQRFHTCLAQGPAGSPSEDGAGRAQNIFKWCGVL